MGQTPPSPVQPQLFIPPRKSSVVIFKEHKSGSGFSVEDTPGMGLPQQSPETTLAAGVTPGRDEAEGGRSPRDGLLCFRQGHKCIGSSTTLHRATPAAEPAEFFRGCYGYRITTVTIAIKAESSASMLS